MTARISATDLGLPIEVTSELPAEQLQRLAATLDAPVRLRAGDALPLPWHWAAFTPDAPSAALGPDGHPLPRADSPMAGLPRRMFAGGRSERHEPLVVGRHTVRTATVLDAQEKQGRSGRLLIVEVAYEFHQDGRLAITEHQDLVYREASSALPALGDPAASAPETSGWRDEITVDRVTLFRFSAATFNAHRIHYDDAYAREVEGYPGLVVHGPLTALLLAGSAADHLGADLTRFAFRATAPLFEGHRFYTVGELDGGEASLRAVRGDGTVAMSATAS